MIPIPECKYGGIYRLRSRNLPYGVYDGHGGFIGIREKFWDYFLFKEYHWDTGRPFGTVTPLELVGTIPGHIKIQESYPSVCSECFLPVEWVPRGDAHGGTWYHLKGNVLATDDEVGHEVHPASYTYVPLFDFLASIEGIRSYQEFRAMTLDERKSLNRVDPCAQE